MNILLRTTLLFRSYIIARYYYIIALCSTIPLLYITQCSTVPLRISPRHSIRTLHTFSLHSAHTFRAISRLPRHFILFHPSPSPQPQRGIKQKAATRRLPPCDSARIQTWNRLIRSQVLYSVELRSHCFAFASANIEQIFLLCKYFAKKIIIKTTDFSAVFISTLYISRLLNVLRKDYFDLLATQILSYELTLW